MVTTTPYVTPVPQCTWPYPVVPDVDGGEVILGYDSTVTIYAAPSNAPVTLYRSWTGQGIEDCETWNGMCLGLLDAEVFGTGTADAAGTITFALPAEDFTETGTHGWQAVVEDPLGDCYVATEAVIRHTGVHPDEGCCVMQLANTSAGLFNTYTSGNTHTGGVAFVDYNGDYWPDIFIASGAYSPNYLYRNDGDGTFTEVSELVLKPTNTLESAAIRYADVDNDGDYDLMIPVDNPAQMISSVPNAYEGGPNLFYLNNGDGTFTDASSTSGLIDPRGWRNSDASFADYDLDGCIDVYLTNWAMAALPAGDNFDRLMRGNCDGTFTDVTAVAGADGLGRDGLVGFWWDADFDLYPELYVGNNSDLDAPPDYMPDDVYYKNHGGSFFENVTGNHPGVGDDARAAMGIDVGDIDLDGDWDMYISDVWELEPVPKGNVLYMGAPDGSLTDNVCQEAGLCLGYNSWPVSFADFNRDMHPDLWVGTSHTTSPDFLFINRGDATFEVHRQVGFLGHMSRGGTAADYDGDGDVDVFFWVEGNDSELFQNIPRDVHNWMEFKLFGQQSTRDAIGAVVRVRAAGVQQMRRVTGGDSAHSQTDSILHFGMGFETVAEEVEVTWPSGVVQLFHDVPVNELVFIDENDGIIVEELSNPVAIWSSFFEKITVTFTTNLGGRSTITVDDIQPGDNIDWNAEAMMYEDRIWGIPTPPASITLRSQRSTGATWVVPVTL